MKRHQWFLICAACLAILAGQILLRNPGTGETRGTDGASPAVPTDGSSSLPIADAPESNSEAVPSSPKSAPSKGTGPAITSGTFTPSATDQTPPAGNRTILPSSAASVRPPLPKLSEYRDALTEEAKQSLDALLSVHPWVEPTEVDDIQQAILEERAKLGRVLDDSTAQTISAIATEWESLQIQAVLHRAKLAGLAIERVSKIGGQETLVGFRQGDPVYIGTSIKKGGGRTRLKACPSMV